MNAKLRSMGRGYFIGALACCLCAPPAWADESASQESAAAEAPENSAADPGAGGAPVAASKRRQPAAAIEEITVTARKREESLQETPISITAFSESDLKDQEIRRISDIQAGVPNLQFDQAVGQSNAARISIRGVGNGDSLISDDPGVGVYIDGVYLPRAQGALLAVSDIARIEVLRGPQGTLFGKNTIGGAVNIVTQKPSFERKGEVSFRAGNYDLFETKFTYNIPLIPERVAARVSFTSKQRDGFTKNDFNNSTIGRNRLLAGRAQLLINATDDLELLFSADHSNEPSQPPAGKCKFIGTLPPGSRRETPPASDTSITAITRFAVAAQTGDPAAFEKKCRAQDKRNEFRTSQDGRFDDELKTFGSNFIATWAPSSALTFKSTTSFRRNESTDSGDADLTDLALSQDGRNDNDKSVQNAYSQEFNFSGIAVDDRLKWTMGLYYFTEDNRNDDRAQTLPITSMVDAVIPTIARRATFGPATTDGIGPCSRPGNVGLTCFVGPNRQSFLKADTKSYAAYSQATFDVTEAFSITGGLRFTHERKRIARQNRIVDPLDPLRFTARTIALNGLTTNIERSGRFDKWTPMLNLQYRFNDDMNAYATYSRGFKSGGFNGRADTTGGALEIDPEVLTSYEAGFKSRFFDNRLVLNTAFFTNVYRDIQLTVIGTDNETGNLAARVDNAGKAVINGTELEVVALPLPGLELSGGVGITAARYVEFKNPGSGASFSNVKLPNTPAYTFNMSASYTLPVSTLGDLRTRVGWSHTGTKASDVSDPHFNRVKKHGVLSGRMAFEFSDGVTEVALFGDNLLDRRYLGNAVLGVSTALQFYAPPRTYGIEVSRQF
jgi:iron complex outermembrane recepter protein